MKSMAKVAVAAACTLTTSGLFALPSVSAAPWHVDKNPFESVLTTDQGHKSGADNAKANDDVYHITMIARDMQFVPSVLQAKAGSKVEIRFHNEGKAPHNITFRTLPYRSATIQKGQSTKLDIVTPAPGRYEFYCSVGNHAHLGMVGHLNVTR